MCRVARAETVVDDGRRVNVLDLAADAIVQLLDVRLVVERKVPVARDPMQQTIE